MSQPAPADLVRPLLRTRQVREFTPEPVDPAALDAIADAARWSGSSQNSQPWRFIVVRDPEVLRAVHAAGQPHTRSLASAAAAIAIAMPTEEGRAISLGYDEGRAAERMLVAATLLGLGAGIAWVRGDGRDAVRRTLGLPEDRFVRTIVAIGHPTASARRPKAARGEARRPRAEMVFEDRWPA
jgi:nitroreductase